MAALTIDNLDKDTEASLYMRASSHGRTIEEEARLILTQALRLPADKKGLGTRIHNRFAAIGGVDLALPERTLVRQPPDFSGSEEP